MLGALKLMAEYPFRALARTFNVFQAKEIAAMTVLSAEELAEGGELRKGTFLEAVEERCMPALPGRVLQDTLVLRRRGLHSHSHRAGAWAQDPSSVQHD